MTRKSGWPNSTGWPFLTRTSAIVPETPAGMSVKTFIASMMQTVVPGWTTEPTVTNGGASGALRGVVGADHRALDHDRLRRPAGGRRGARLRRRVPARRAGVRPIRRRGGSADGGGRAELGSAAPQPDLDRPSMKSSAVRSYRFIRRTR